MWPFACKHPAASLHAVREQSVVAADEDFEHVTYHLRCAKCWQLVDVGHARLIGGVDAFLARQEAA